MDIWNQEMLPGHTYTYRFADGCISALGGSIFLVAWVDLVSQSILQCGVQDPGKKYLN